MSDSLSPYHQLVSCASGLVETELIAGDQTISDEQAAQLVESNRRLLDEARRILGLGCAVPPRFDTESWSENTQGLDSLRMLFAAFSVRFRIEKMGNQLDAAIQTGSDMLELANAVRRNGLIVNQLISSGFTAAAIGQLRRIRHGVNELQRRYLFAELRRIESECESFESIATRDVKWDQDVWTDQANQEPLDVNELLVDPDEFGISIDDQLELQRLFQESADRPVEARHADFRQLDQRAIAVLRLLSVDLAIRSFREASSSYPSSLVLVDGDFWDELPSCPFSGNPFVYRRVSADEFQLYSVGPTRIDHGGVFGSWPHVVLGQADLCLDADDYEDAFYAAQNASRTSTIARWTNSIRRSCSRYFHRASG